MRWMLTVAVLVLGLVASAARAQAAAACTPGGGVGSFIMYGLEPRHGAPFTGVVVTTFDQTLADGNTIHTVSHSRQARDADGRTRSEMAAGCARGADGEMHPIFNVNVQDPVAKTSLSWQVNELGPKLVHVFHQPEPPTRTVTPEEQAAMLARQKAAEYQPCKVGDGDDLGSKTIHGVVAEGTRRTRTIPAGEEGNTLPLNIVHEEWRSRDLGLLLMAMDDDPRRGRTTAEYEELTLGEPDAALFAPPADYKVQETHPMQTTVAQ